MNRLNITVPSYIMHEFETKIDNGMWWRGCHHYAIFPAKGVSLDTLWHHLCDLKVVNLFVNKDFIVGFDANDGLENRDDNIVDGTSKIYMMDYPLRKEL